MSEIIRKIGNLEVFQRKQDGYINSTQLCKAYERKTGIIKRPSSWFETDRANRLIEVVSDHTGLEVSELFIVVQGGFASQQGSWIHPDLSIPFASWLSPEFEYMVSKWVQEWMKTGDNPIEKVEAPPIYRRDNILEPNLQEIEYLFDDFKDLGIDPILIKSAKLSAIGRSIPRLASAVEEGKKLLSSQMKVEEIPVSPTQLGEEIYSILDLEKPPSARKVNEILMSAGFQKKQESYDSKGKKKVVWELTELGERYGKLLMDTAKGHAKTVHCVRWSSKVIPLIQEYFVA